VFIPLGIVVFWFYRRLKKVVEVGFFGSIWYLRVLSSVVASPSILRGAFYFRGMDQSWHEEFCVLGLKDAFRLVRVNHSLLVLRLSKFLVPLRFCLIV